MRMYDRHLPSFLPYMAFFYDARARTKAGEKQKKCKKCRYWLWPHEWGTAPAAAPEEK